MSIESFAALNSPWFLSNSQPLFPQEVEYEIFSYCTQESTLWNICCVSKSWHANAKEVTKIFWDRLADIRKLTPTDNPWKSCSVYVTAYNAYLLRVFPELKLPIEKEGSVFEIKEMGDSCLSAVNERTQILHEALLDAIGDNAHGKISMLLEMGAKSSLDICSGSLNFFGSRSPPGLLQGVNAEVSPQVFSLLIEGVKPDFSLLELAFERNRFDLMKVILHAWSSPEFIEAVKIKGSHSKYAFEWMKICVETIEDADIKLAEKLNQCDICLHSLYFDDLDEYLTKYSDCVKSIETALLCADKPHPSVLTAVLKSQLSEDIKVQLFETFLKGTTFKKLYDESSFYLPFWESSCAETLFKMLMSYGYLPPSNFLESEHTFEALSAETLQLYLDKGGSLSDRHLSIAIRSLSDHPTEKMLATLQVFVNANCFELSSRTFDVLIRQKIAEEVIQFACEHSAVPSALGIRNAIVTQRSADCFRLLLKAASENCVTDPIISYAEWRGVSEEIIELLKSFMHPHPVG